MPFRPVRVCPSAARSLSETGKPAPNEGWAMPCTRVAEVLAPPSLTTDLAGGVP